MFKSKKVASKCNFNVNYISYILIYLVYSSIFVFLNNYFPILFFNVLDIDRIILALVQFLAYSVLLLRPVFASITDRYKINGYQRKYYIIFSGYSLVIIYIFMGFYLTNLFVFGLLLISLYITSTMLDVSTKSLVIDISSSNEMKKRNLFFILVGDAFGKFIPFLLFFILINDIYSVNSWKALIIYSYIFFIPFLSILPFIREYNQDKPNQIIEKSEIVRIYEPNNSVETQFTKITLILLCVFVFFAFSDAIFVYAFFPFLINRFGLEKFNLFNFILIFYFLISITSSSVGSFIMKRTNPKKIILTLIPIIGIIYTLYSIAPFTLFIILYLVGCSLGTITNLNISVFVMRFKINDKSVYFHLITSFRHLSISVFLPLGTLLSNFITPVYLIIIGAILLNLSLFPLISIKLQE